VRSSGDFGNVNAGGFDDRIKSFLIGFLLGAFSVLPVSITNNNIYDYAIISIILLSSYLLLAGIICGRYCRYLVLPSLSFIFIFSLAFTNTPFKGNTDAHIGFIILPMVFASNIIFLFGVCLGRLFDFRWMKEKKSGS
jgi:hypothetical protein